MADGWIWSWAADGIHSTKVVTYVLDKAVFDLCHEQTAWSSLASKKVNIFLWRAKRSLLPCRLQLAFKGIEIDTLSCPICHFAVEDQDHALLACWAVYDIWSAIGHWCGLDFSDITEVINLASQSILILMCFRVGSLKGAEQIGDERRLMVYHPYCI